MQLRSYRLSAQYPHECSPSLPKMRPRAAWGGGPYHRPLYH